MPVFTIFNFDVFLQAPNSPSLSVFSFNIKDYIEEGEISSFASKIHQEEPILLAVVRGQLELMLPHLEKDIADLACNAKQLHDIFLAIKGELSHDLLDVLSPTAFIEDYAPKVIRAK